MSARYRRRDDLRIAELEDEGVVLHLGSREYYTVSETGLVILGALETDRTVGELVEALTDAYEVSPEHARESVDAFLRECLAQGFLHETDGG